MNNAYIKDIVVYLPNNTISNYDLCHSSPGWDPEKIFDKIGVKTRHCCDKDETSFTLGYCACKLLLAQNPFLTDSIDYILYSTNNHEHFMMCSAALLQSRLGLSRSCGVFVLKLSCAGYLQLLQLAKSLIVSGIATNVLVVTADTYTKRISKNDIGTKTIFGDAATASVISTSGRVKIGDIELGSDGIGTEYHVRRTGCVKRPLPEVALNEDYLSTPIDNDSFYMIGPEIFDFVTGRIPLFVRDYLTKHKESINGIDSFIFHQANKFMLGYIKRELSIPDDKFFLMMENVGNTSTSSIPLCLSEFLSLNNKGRLFLCSFGGGYTWGGGIVEVL